MVTESVVALSLSLLVLLATCCWRRRTRETEDRWSRVVLLEVTARGNLDRWSRLAEGAKRLSTRRRLFAYTGHHLRALKAVGVPRGLLGTFWSRLGHEFAEVKRNGSAVTGGGAGYDRQ